MSRYADLCTKLDEKGMPHKLVRVGAGFELRVEDQKGNELARTPFEPGKPDAAAQRIAELLLTDLP